MTEYIFQSSMAKRMTAFIALKRLSGTPYRTQTLMLKYFDQFLVRDQFKLQWVTPDVFQRYVATLGHLCVRYRWARCNMVQQFCVYLSQFEPECHIPEIEREQRSTDYWRAHIFTNKQIENLLAAASRLRHGHWLRPHTYRVLFGLLYTTGMRLGEALALNVGDFYPDTLRLHVRAGKFRKERWVPVSPSTGDVLMEYVELRAQVVARCVDEPLFVSQQRTRLARCTAEEVFNQLLRRVGIQKRGRDGPRVHDLRHSFACHRLLRWYRDGKDVNARLPALATYMGHVWISSTQVYIQATAELHECANQRFLDYVYKNNITNGRES